MCWPRVWGKIRCFPYVELSDGSQQVEKKLSDGRGISDYVMYYRCNLFPCYTPLQHNFPLDPMISSFHIHFGTFVMWLRENYDYRNVSWASERACVTFPLFGQGKIIYFFLMVICNSLLLLKSLPINVINCIRFYVINCYTPLQHNFPLDPMISSFHIHFGTFVTWLRENYHYAMHHGRWFA
jgi:hypothetical protein